jgi:hypothetical protein
MSGAAHGALVLAMLGVAIQAIIDSREWIPIIVITGAAYLVGSALIQKD